MAFGQSSSNWGGNEGSGIRLSKANIVFEQAVSFAYPFQDVSLVRIDGVGDEATINVRMDSIGLVGANGLLPYHYTDYLLERLKEKDCAFYDFTNLIFTRAATLAYEALAKSSIPLSVERSFSIDEIGGTCSNPSNIFRSLMGFNNKTLKEYISPGDESVIEFASFFLRQEKTASEMKAFLEGYFKVPIVIEDFLGYWADLLSDVQWFIGSGKAGSKRFRLGVNTLIGRRAWISQGAVNVTLGPLNRKQISQFGPGSDAIKKVALFTSIFVGIDQNLRIYISAKREDFPTTFQLSKQDNSQLGWSSRLPICKSDKKNSDILSVCVSRN